jgi:serine/threonine protein kinase/Flp pilus assembly protein TadD
MESDRWQRLWAAFHAALERAPGEDRAAFARDAAAGDDSFARELDSLLAAHDADANLLSAEAARLAGLAAAELVPGTRIGPYRIERLIGEGGMGLVYEATQEAPVRRRVALKLIKLGMDTREVVRRFEAERQALARMEHGSIARVFDAGATPEGRPYFAMERVDGPSITDYCDRERLPIARRLELLIAVCRAVHHAHQKGVIHRDLKASNVLVASEEGRPVPKVIDFGVARAIEDRSASGTLLTRLGQIVGTPETMSPEQAALSADVDTRTDVYSLGALIYELVSGAPPFDRRASDSASLTELLRRIRDDEPPPPSARFARSGEVAAEIAARRGSDPARLRRELAGELDWIVARAMAKERDRRYGSAAELADELERYLAGRPVAAGPPSRVYRFRKLVARNRIAAAAAAALLLALLLFGTVMAIQARRLARALANEARERSTATQISDFLVELLEQPDPAVARGREPSVREALDRGAAKIERDLAGQPEIQARLLETIGRVQLNLGQFEAAERAYRRALELRRGLAGAASAEAAAVLQRLAEIDFERARYPQAGAGAREALALRRALYGELHPAVAESLHLVALVARQAGDLGEAERLHREALAIQRATLPPDDPALADSSNYLGIVRRRRNDYAGAEAAYREAIAIWRRALGDDHPKVAMATNNLALVAHVAGDYGEARVLFEELLPVRLRLLGETHPDYLVTLFNYGKLLHDEGDLEAAAAVYERALELARRALGDEHPQVAAILAESASVLAGLDRTDEALARAERALAVRRKIFGGEHATIASSLGYLAEVRGARGERDEAERLYAASVAMFERTNGRDARTGEALLAWGGFALEHGRFDLAQERLEAALALFRAQLPASDPRIARAERALGAAFAGLR